jgi:tetratricopeptide (TPR) repeat protein
VTTSSRAYEQFVRGNVLLARRTAASLEGAVASYRAATVVDSGLADAYGRLAYAYGLCNWWGACGRADSTLAQSRQAAASALRHNPRSSDAWMGRGLMLAVWSQNPGVDSDDSLLASLAAFRRAVDLNPLNAEAWHQFGALLRTVNDSASLDALRRSLVLDPARGITYVDLSITYDVMGQNERALTTVDSAVALEPDGPFRADRAMYRLLAGDTAGAIADARVTPGQESGPSVLAAFAHDSAAVRTMEARAAQPGCGLQPATYLLWTGRRELAVQRLLACGPSLYTRWWLRFSVLAPLADDPRIQALRAETERILARARWR